MSEFKLYITTDSTNNKPLAVLKEGKQVVGEIPNVSTDGLLLISRAVELISEVKGINFSKCTISMGR